MTKHLRPEELVDLAEGVRAQSEAPHLSTCEACRRQLADLRATLATMTAAEVPEPSPRFWDRFSERVRDAVTAEPTPRRVGWLSGWNPRRWRIPAPLAGAVAALVVAVAMMRYGSIPGMPGVAEPPATARPTAVESAADASSSLPLAATDDPTLLLVADLTADLDLDGASEAGLTTPAHAHGADDLISTLTDVERLELQRLLQEELAKPRA